MARITTDAFHVSFDPKSDGQASSVMPAWHEETQRNTFFLLATLAFGGHSPDRFILPPIADGISWETKFFYNIPGFEDSHRLPAGGPGDPDIEYDRVIMRAGNLQLCWQFWYSYTYRARSERYIQYAYHYASPFPQAGFEYMGRMQFAHGGDSVGGQINSATWSTSPDPNPKPEILP